MKLVVPGSAKSSELSTEQASATDDYSQQRILSNDEFESLM